MIGSFSNVAQMRQLDRPEGVPVRRLGLMLSRGGARLTLWRCGGRPDLRALVAQLRGGLRTR